MCLLWVVGLVGCGCGLLVSWDLGSFGWLFAIDLVFVGFGNVVL